MCGIAGVISNNKNKVSKLRKMLAAQEHRGPDGQGEWSDYSVALGMRRLSIIDLKGGMQPLFNEDKSIVVVGNGEIYNYKKLNKLVFKMGHKPKTRSDIETIIHLYEEYGTNFIKKLNGMFAFALYDIKKNKVIICRDRMGEKPIYYNLTSENLYFASEFKAITQTVKPGNIDLNAVNLYFHYYYVPEPKTLVTNIHKLPAGHYLEFDLLTRKANINQYWDPSKFPPIKYQDPIKKFRNTLEKAVKDTLVSDVEVGISLSGGLDSGAIMAIAARNSRSKLKAFTVGYDGRPTSDERNLAALMAKKYGVEHIQIEVKTQDVISHFPRLVYDCDDPIADIAAHGIYTVAKLARSHGVKVLLGGIGGDELFWGYPWTREVTKNNSKNMNSFHLFDKITPYLSAKSFLSKITTNTFKLQVNTSLPFDIFQPTKKLESKIELGRHTQNMLRDIWLKSNCIALSDRLSMAASVELRSPLLAHDFIETAYASVRNTLAYNKTIGKYWFRKAIKYLVPRDILTAPKRGFQPPVFRWLFSLLYKYISILSNGYLVKNRIINRHKISIISWTWVINPFRWPAIYQLILLEIWCREYLWGQDPTTI